MDLTWLFALAGFVVPQVVTADEQGHEESGLIGTGLVASHDCGRDRPEPGGILFGPI
jgi:hypothetical protein